jgi:hypothetical protein
MVPCNAFHMYALPSPIMLPSQALITERDTLIGVLFSTKPNTATSRERHSCKVSPPVNPYSGSKLVNLHLHSSLKMSAPVSWSVPIVTISQLWLTTGLLLQG